MLKQSTPQAKPGARNALAQKAPRNGETSRNKYLIEGIFLTFNKRAIQSQRSGLKFFYIRYLFNDL